LYHLPFLKQDRYPLQTIASLHSAIMAHLSTLQQSITEVLNSWKSSLKPLDAKLQPLLRLLQNYGVDDQPLGAIFKHYIIVGHTADSSSVANAMDQFFTSVQMNDQLVQRMERSLHGSLANVESQARKGLLSPMQALCFQIQELAGLVQFHGTGNSASLQALVDASHLLWIGVEGLLTAIITSRFRVRDLCGWLRSAGSQIKARGTAANSVQRENAKKRRVPEVVLERLLAVLNTLHMEKGACLSEHLLDMKVSVRVSFLSIL
jgi:predicted component of type VI protein secretion system